MKSGTLAENVYVTVSSEVYHLTGAGAIAFNDDETLNLANTTGKTEIMNAEIHTVGAVEYVFKTGNILRDGNNNITNGLLAVATPITISNSSYTLAIDTKVFFDAEGSFLQGKISATQYVINRVLHTFESGSVKTDASGSLIQGRVSATEYVIKGTVFSFSSAPTVHDNGVVDSGALTTATTVDVVDTSQDPALTNTFSFTNISFHDNGAVTNTFSFGE